MVKKKNGEINGFRFFKKIIFSSQGFPILLICALMSILFVLFRMKSVELDYKVVNIDKEIHQNELEQKELKAKKARILSVKNLKDFAKQHHLGQPKQEQIIVIP